MLPFPGKEGGMQVDPLTELTTIEGLLREAADIPEDARESALWCLRQLPAPYQAFARTYDARHAEEALRLVRAALQKLGRSSSAAAVREQLAGLHERLGLGDFQIEPAPAPARRS